MGTTKTLRKEFVEGIKPHYNRLGFEYQNINDYSIEVFRKRDVDCEHVILFEFNSSFDYLDFQIEMGIKIDEIEDRLNSLGFKERPDNMFLTVRTKLGRYLTNLDGLRINPEENIRFDLDDDNIQSTIESVLKYNAEIKKYFKKFSQFKTLHKVLNKNYSNTSCLIFEYPERVKRGLVICKLLKPKKIDTVFNDFKKYFLEQDMQKSLGTLEEVYMKVQDA